MESSSMTSCIAGVRSANGPAEPDLPTTPLLNRRAAAKFLTDLGYPTAYATLAKLAVVGGGPEFIQWGARQVLYEQSKLTAWAEARGKRKRSTSDRGAVLGSGAR
jgi:hypothetical protein